MKIVTFSGIDGAGKSTQIRAFSTWLDATGQRCELLTFWDNVVTFPRLREFMSHKAFGGDQGIGSPAKPLARRDKNVTAWPVTAVRFCLYLADAMNTRRIVNQVRGRGADVVIFDRYIYDELANLPLRRWWARAFVRLALWIVPQPHAAYVIDAAPAAAYARKPEYPLEFLRSNRAAYLALAALTGHMTVIEPRSPEEMGLEIREAFLRIPLPQKTEIARVPALQ